MLCAQPLSTPSAPLLLTVASCFVTAQPLFHHALMHAHHSPIRISLSAPCRHCRSVQLLCGCDAQQMATHIVGWHSRVGVERWATSLGDDIRGRGTHRDAHQGHVHTRCGETACSSGQCNWSLDVSYHCLLDVRGQHSHPAQLCFTSAPWLTLPHLPSDYRSPHGNPPSQHSFGSGAQRNAQQLDVVAQFG